MDPDLFRSFRICSDILGIFHQKHDIFSVPGTIDDPVPGRNLTAHVQKEKHLSAFTLFSP
jgi:hypothetical protein